ncbi:hypothetical protein [Nocardioides piscis]|uniref:Uncharacterized protein n=1 Tax=Nocardioides piscis TaxID=2714938 RepID=A0A6G7YHQ8_9ACTN|nr:hypothetical protein [Nocardioides piscis]QIK76342.1 hypothetical protein G7071_13870 [Nocardioides piscis]
MTSTDELLARLETTLDALPILSKLSPDQVSVLDEAVVEAMRTEDEAFEQGMQGALALVPRPFRGPARGLLFPKGDRG